MNDDDDDGQHEEVEEVDEWWMRNVVFSNHDGDMEHPKKGDKMVVGPEKDGVAGVEEFHVLNENENENEMNEVDNCADKSCY